MVAGGEEIKQDRVRLPAPSEVVEKCALCESSQSALFERYDSKIKRTEIVFSLDYRICTYCGLVFMSPRFTGDELDAFYAAEYRLLYHGDEKPVESNLQEQKQRGAHLAAVVSLQRPTLGSHLDVGCSSGVLLQEFRNRLNTKILCGIEPSNSHREAARAAGIEVFASLQELAEAAAGGAVPQKFDIVSLSHVLEHLPDPVGYLKNLHQNWVVDDGLLLIEVPNLLGHASLEVAHLFAFDPKTLREVIEKAGFSVVSTKTHDIPRGGGKERYITMVAAAGAQPAARVAQARWQLTRLRRDRGLSGRSWPLFFGGRILRSVGLRKKK